MMRDDSAGRKSALTLGEQTADVALLDSGCRSNVRPVVAPENVPRTSAVQVRLAPSVVVNPTILLLSGNFCLPVASAAKPPNSNRGTCERRRRPLLDYHAGPCPLTRSHLLPSG